MTFVTANIFNDEIFVYGANLKGIHGAGAAKTAKEFYGARTGKWGFYKNSYGIPTKSDPYTSLSLQEVKYQVSTFLNFAEIARNYTFKVTPIGCGLAGFRIEEIAPMFAIHSENVILPPEFINYFQKFNQDSLAR